MFYGLIILCTIGTTDINKEDCTLYASPTVYDHRPTCYEAIKQFVRNEQFVASALAMNMIPVNAKCVDLAEKDVQGLQT